MDLGVEKCLTDPDNNLFIISFNIEKFFNSLVTTMLIRHTCITIRPWWRFVPL